jgi:hypothetical protein
MKQREVKRTFSPSGLEKAIEQNSVLDSKRILTPCELDFLRARSLARSKSYDVHMTPRPLPRSVLCGKLVHRIQKSFIGAESPIR